MLTSWADAVDRGLTHVTVNSLLEHRYGDNHLLSRMARNGARDLLHVASDAIRRRRRRSGLALDLYPDRAWADVTRWVQQHAQFEDTEHVAVMVLDHIRTHRLLPW